MSKFFKQMEAIFYGSFSTTYSILNTFIAFLSSNNPYFATKIMLLVKQNQSYGRISKSVMQMWPSLIFHFWTGTLNLAVWIPLLYIQIQHPQNTLYANFHSFFQKWTSWYQIFTLLLGYNTVQFFWHK